MKILIAGKGFIGGAVGEKLEKHEVSYLDRSGGDYQEDITEEFSIDESFDVLIHTIGLAPGFSSPESYRRVQVEGTRNLLEAIDAEKVIYISALKAGEIDHSFFRTKREAEELIQESGNSYTIIRPSTVYGDGNKLLEMIRKLSFTRIFPDLDTMTQPIMVEDLADMISETVSGYDNQILEAGGPEKMKMGELARVIYREEERRCFLVPYTQFLLELKLIGLSFLPPPFQRENIQILRSENTTENNDAEDIVDLEPIR